MGSDQPFHISDLSHVFFFFFFERGDILIFKINQNMHELKIGFNTSQIWLAQHSHGKGEIFFWVIHVGYKSGDTAEKIHNRH